VSRTKRAVIAVLAGCALTPTPDTVTPAPATFSVHRNSQATFRTDAPLETVVGTTAGSGTVTGSVTVDPVKPAEATGTIRVDLSTLKTGIANRDAHMVGPDWLDVQDENNRYAVFVVTGVEIGGPLEPGREVPAKVKGTLTVKRRPIDVVADARITYLRLSGPEAEAPRRSGFGPEVLRVRTRLQTRFTDHGMQVPQFYFLRVSNEIQLEVDLILTR